MQDEELWVFGYGSLLWNPGFAYIERRLATLHGFHRAFCMYSVHYRGSAAHPGLVLALEARAGAECQGVGFRVAAEMVVETLAYLRERELISAAYLEETHEILFQDGRRAKAVCYVINRNHTQYAGGLSLGQQAEIIQKSTGSAGTNAAYLENTAVHLEELGIVDHDIVALDEMIKKAGPP
ncbi:MAG: gamma-glutamylcyclotransferase [Paracoccaceae bacterium]